MQLGHFNVLGLAPHEELEALVEELWGVLTYEGLQVVSELRVVQEVCGEGVGVRVDQVRNVGVVHLSPGDTLRRVLI